jgi:hypothetical protein
METPEPKEEYRPMIRDDVYQNTDGSRMILSYWNNDSPFDFEDDDQEEYVMSRPSVKILSDIAERSHKLACELHIGKEDLNEPEQSEAFKKAEELSDYIYEQLHSEMERYKLVQKTYPNID